MDQLNGLLKKFPCRTNISVHWGDMDAAQHVNNVVYLRWAETARIDYLRLIGWENISEKDDIGVILAYQDIKYLFPVTYPDTIVLGTKVMNWEEYRFNMLCHYVSERHQRLVAIANFQLVTYDYKLLKKAPIPEALFLKIQQCEESY